MVDDLGGRRGGRFAASVREGGPRKEGKTQGVDSCMRRGALQIARQLENISCRSLGEGVV